MSSLWRGRVGFDLRSDIDILQRTAVMQFCVETVFKSATGLKTVQTNMSVQSVKRLVISSRNVLNLRETKNSKLFSIKHLQMKSNPIIIATIVIKGSHDTQKAPKDRKWPLVNASSARLLQLNV